MKHLTGPMLELADATPVFDESSLPPVPLSLRVMPGECAVIETRDMSRATMFADLCSGMVHLRNGSARFMDMNWDDLDDRHRNALRGRIGRITRRPLWTDLFGTHVGIMLRELHHTTVSVPDLTSETVRLCTQFGLPGVPVETPRRLSSADLVRASCVRAFLGQPQLLLIEDPLEGSPVDISGAFFECLTEARDRGASVVWFVRDSSVWQPYRRAVSGLWRLADDGLLTVRIR
ncbi:ABC transporter ATP-binding protein [Acetobacter sp.]|uniref:ABC transporter ATP-binding protein n=1 Tax=Acetobacter sp. TaxID=440 RepID=UPI0025BEB6FA|nr:ABC transporter ATP-binding protein [Acetobacter sp.]MCH4090439.1 ABC transporter ATP-binding protein [Acetobacter sp.]MCI1299133.1 ABC transporter ATP-binding protein [Acetobacter sp.]MCI1315680.1 ABC transporter ATP-binding protein [Acetobacter sp.]